MYKRDAVASQIASERLPHPQGYKILIAMPGVEEKTGGGVYIPEDLKQREEVASILGRVISMGPDAYADKTRTAVPWCKPGDWVIFRAYSGTRFIIDKQEFRLINDDTVEAVVPDPTGYKRV